MAKTQQALYSYRLRFDFPTDAGILNYLRGREFIADEGPLPAEILRLNMRENTYLIYI